MLSLFHFEICFSCVRFPALGFLEQSSYNRGVGSSPHQEIGSSVLFQFRQSQPNTQISPVSTRRIRVHNKRMDKIAGLKEILFLDPKNSFARYGIAMELAGRGETTAALEEFDLLLANDPDYTAGYFMAAQTLVAAGRNPEAIERLKVGIGCAARSGNTHALSEMQAMLGDLER